MVKTQKTSTKQEKQVHKVSYYEAVGRRKEATARVRLYVLVGDDAVSLSGVTLKAGDMIVNKKPIHDYFPGLLSKTLYNRPFELTQTVGRFAMSAVVEGGGPAGQRQALMHGISRALLVADTDTYRPMLKKHGLLMRDPRTKERRKAGMAQKARAGKQSPKR